MSSPPADHPLLPVDGAGPPTGTAPVPTMLPMPEPAALTAPMSAPLGPAAPLLPPGVDKPLQSIEAPNGPVDRPTPGPTVHPAGMPTPTPTPTIVEPPSLAAVAAPPTLPTGTPAPGPTPTVAAVEQPVFDPADLPTLPAAGSPPVATPPPATEPLPGMGGPTPAPRILHDADLPSLPSSRPAVAPTPRDDTDQDAAPGATAPEDGTEGGVERPRTETSTHPMAHLMGVDKPQSEASRRAAEIRAAKRAKARKIKIGVAVGALVVSALLGPPLVGWLVNAINEAGSTQPDEG